MDEHEDTENTENVEDAAAQAEAQEEAGDTADTPADATNPLEELTAERDRMREQLLRTAADFENFKKRSRRDMQERERRVREDTLREILPIVDNLERAVSTSADATDVQTVIDGVRMVLKLFEDTGERLGLTRVQAMGERFDPNHHDALQQIEQADVEPGTIVAELVPGYRLGERLLRPAMVVVARAPEESKAVTDTLIDGDDVFVPEDEPDDPSETDSTDGDDAG